MENLSGGSLKDKDGWKTEWQLNDWWLMSDDESWEMARLVSDSSERAKGRRQKWMWDNEIMGRWNGKRQKWDDKWMMVDVRWKT